MTKYKFKVKATYPDGNKGTFHGDVFAEDDGKAFDKAVEAVKAITPDAIVDRTKPGQIVITRRKQ